MPQQSRKIALVTGSTDGVGRFVAERLGADGWDVIVHGRDAERGAEVVATIAAVGGGARFLSADLSDLAAVRGLAEQVAKAAPRLDLLINNAGIGAGGSDPRRQLNAAGVELRFAVNYLAGFLLTHRLLPLLKKNRTARIVNVSSGGQQEIEFDDVMLTRGYDGRRAYRQSKLAQILFTVDLAEQLKGTGVTVNALHPATYMDTPMVRAEGIAPLSTVEEGADAILNLATSPELEGRSGLYFNGLTPARANAQAYDARSRAQLRALSLELVGLKAAG